MDIGFGRGELLYTLRRLGAETLGLDLDRDAIRIARALRIDAIHGNTADLPKGRVFDSIFAFDVVEHPLNPMEMIEQSTRHLCSGGLLAIWTPNGGSLAGDEIPVALRVDLEHMQYFTAETCAYIANKLGMDIVHLETVGYPALGGIKAVAARDGWKPRVKQLAKGLPGAKRAHNLWSRPSSYKERSGNYHLFCVMQKR